MLMNQIAITVKDLANFKEVIFMAYVSHGEGLFSLSKNRQQTYNKDITSTDKGFKLLL